VEPGAPLKAATSEEGLTTKEAWWAGYRAGKGLPADTPRQEALAQQPAAVDEAMTRRIMSEFHANDPGDVWPPDEQGRLRRKALQDAINNALATQHQGPTT